MRIHIDFETRSAVDLIAQGGYRYAMDPSTDVLIMGWRTDRMPKGVVNAWRRGDPPPVELFNLIVNGATVVAFHAAFEFAVWMYVCHKKYGWPPLSPYQLECVMARCLAVALPGSLAMAAKILNAPLKKNPEGVRLINFFSVPRKNGGTDLFPGLFNEPEEHPGLFDKFVNYCLDDVGAECWIDENVPPLSEGETRIFQFDQLVNARGFRLNTELMLRADTLIEAAKDRMDDEIHEITCGFVSATTQVEQIKSWAANRGVKIHSLTKDKLPEIKAIADMAGDTQLKRVLELRQEGAKATSLSKYRTGLQCVGPDGRARGLFRYHKASTGRWAGELYQPHNLERVDPDHDAPIVNDTLDVLRSRLGAEDCFKWFDLLGYRPMKALGKATRAMVEAAPGHILYGADFSNVEGRGSAWLAGESWKVEAFQAFDEGTGPDLYKLAYSKTFNQPIESVGSFQRSAGKVQELALQFGGGPGALAVMAANYGIDREKFKDLVLSVATGDRWAKAGWQWPVAKGRTDMTQDQWTAFTYVVQGWRSAHSNTVGAWYTLSDALCSAVSDPGSHHLLFEDRVRVYCEPDGRFLYVFRPSGEPLCYYKPSIRSQELAYVNEKGEIDTRVARGVWYWGYDIDKRWTQLNLSTNKAWENLIQSICRDILAHNLLICEANGFPVVMHVHDEGVFEVEDDGGASLSELKKLMSTVPEWAKGFPLACAAWHDRRYVK